jgi:hypothetical protein
MAPMTHLAAGLCLTLVFTGLGPLACGASTPPSAMSPTVTIGAEVPSTADASPPLAHAEPPEAGGGNLLRGNESPNDRRVLAPADRQLLAESKQRAQVCLAKAKVRGRMRVNIELDEEGAPNPMPEFVEQTISATVARCVIDALGRGRYARPGVRTSEGITVGTIAVTIESGLEPQEFQVD